MSTIFNYVKEIKSLNVSISIPKVSGYQYFNQPYVVPAGRIALIALVDRSGSPINSSIIGITHGGRFDLFGRCCAGAFWPSGFLILYEGEVLRVITYSPSAPAFVDNISMDFSIIEISANAID